MPTIVEAIRGSRVEKRTAAVARSVPYAAQTSRMRTIASSVAGRAGR